MSAARRVEKLEPVTWRSGHMAGVTDPVPEHLRPKPGGISRALSALRPEDDRESMLLLGLALLAVGCGAIWLPLAAVVPGVVVTFAALASYRAPRQVSE